MCQSALNIDQHEPNTKEVLGKALVCYTAVFSVVTQRFSPIVSGEKRCKTTPKRLCSRLGKPLKSLKVILTLSQFVLAIMPCRGSPITSRKANNADGISSKNLPVTPGVPQGSTLASFFFFFWSLSMIFPVLLATLLQSLQTTQSTVM